MKLAKLTLTLATFAFAAATVFVVPMANVKADDVIDQTNGTTGPHSFNKNKFKVVRKAKTVKNNYATATTVGSVTTKTGGNKVKNNTTGGDLTAGGITVAGTVDNTLNQAAAATCCCDQDPVTAVDVNQRNNITGPHSDNINNAKVVDKETCKETNNAIATTVLDVNAHTGNNEVNGNTSAGNLTSGDIGVTFNVTNTLN